MEDAEDRYGELTRLPLAFVLDAKMRVDVDSFCKELLRAERHVLGRFDARFKGSDSSTPSAVAESDPSDAALKPTLSASLGEYFRNQLKYDPLLDYRLGIQDDAKSTLISSMPHPPEVCSS